MKFNIIENGVITNIVKADPDYAASQGWAKNNGEQIGWSADGSRPVRPRSEYIEQVRQKAESVRNGGTTVNGLHVATDAEARSLLIGGQVNPRTNRKIVTKGGRAAVSQAQYSAMVEAIVSFVQAVIDKEYDLLELIDTTADADLHTLDLDSGWPK